MRNKFFKMRLILLVCVTFLWIKNAQGYKAAVFEHFATKGDTAEDTILGNLEAYKRQISSARDQGVDIIVFPEYGLTTTKAQPLEEYSIEVKENETVIEELRDAAIEHNIYIVVNLLEKVKESNKKTKYYNTNLVFSSNGTIVAKYHKINLYDEKGLTPGNEIVTFTTDFGVTFGVFTCFDILFQNPARAILESGEVTDIVFPTAWMSTMPFHTSLTVQHGYAVANGINLLTANYDHPSNGYGGSGIYLADGSVGEMYIDDTQSSKLLTKNVRKISSQLKPTECSNFAPQGLPVDPDEPVLNNFKLHRSFRASDYAFADVDLLSQGFIKEICHNGFCCRFTITLVTKSDKKEYYKLMAYNGTDTFDNNKVHVQICSLLACENDSKNTCGKRVDIKTKLNVKVEGSFKNDNETFYTPVTLKPNLQPMLKSIYCAGTKSNTTEVKLFSSNSENILVFGLYGIKDFTNDGRSSAVMNSSIFCFVFLVFIKFLL